MSQFVKQHEIFKDHLKNFEAVLNGYGYFFKNSSADKKEGRAFESTWYNYFNEATKIEISFGFAESFINSEYDFSVNFHMLNNDRKSFVLFEYERRHPEYPKIKSDHFDHDHFEPDAKIFFESLKTAFATHLNDHIEGRSFEDHRDYIMREFYSHGAVRDMQKQVIADAQRSRNSLWVRFKRLWQGE